MSWGESALWIVAPYVTLVILVGGLIWRHRYDRFGWTTRSSQLYEGRLLRVASPLFHYGLLVVIVGHAIGLLIPASWIQFVPAHAYHLAALVFGGIAGLCTVAGLALLIYRRRVTGPVFLATTRNDKLMFVLLGLAILAGLAATVSGVLPEQADYRETVSPWFRGIFTLQPDAEAMAAATTVFKIHVLAGMVLFAVFPFTRLVHALSAPIGYLFRPYIVYRSR
ncbi:respiratory nitrate reductase subunit gamma [Nonomuraea sediminis]|uniref:respiratory nitrate reductase subunit gamma n=1 Tax=Nonomuraea sediminis TaxID=2835864 RepID=UPI001BDD662D|nr:respiratory nitrate reductase subunit gamma [Nonomuraea sediminis]